MSTMKCRYNLFKAKSRSDDTLLTVDFNLRKLHDVHTLQSPARTTQWIDKVLSPAGHFAVDTTVVKNIRLSLKTYIMVANENLVVVIRAVI